MADWTRTNLSCTNPEIISSGSTFYKNTDSILLGSEDNVFHYLTDSSFMHEELIELSKIHPDQTFTATTWEDTEYYDRVIWRVIYHSGKWNEISKKPGYVFTYPINSDEELTKKFMARINLYLERIERTRHNIKGEKEFDLISHEKDNDGFSSYLTITWENQDHRFIATNKYGYMFEIEYQNKDKENLQKLKEKLNLLELELDAIRKAKENETDDSEDFLPF